MKSKRLVLLLGVLILVFATASLSLAQTPPDQLLLKDYRPKSIYNIPVTRVEKARFPVIDAHSHAYAETPEQIAQWVRNLDQAGVEKVFILSYEHGARFDSIYAEYAKYPGRFEIWCGIDNAGYDQPGWGEKAVAELERCYKAGARGVGELGDKGKGLVYGRTPALGMHLDDPRMDPVLEKCADLGMPVNIHVADPMWMYQPMDSTNDGLMNAYSWRLDNQPGIVDLPGMVEILGRAVARHPRTTFIACHFANCSYDLNRLGALLDKYPNLYADISARYAETAPIPRFVKKFYEKYQDRLLYGTDMGMDLAMYRITFRILETEDEHFYESDLFGYHWALNGFGLDGRILEKVYRGNILKLIKHLKK
ncbi:MAG TPA: amidohydrolase family protein [bacterium]|jgi:predicted TIM-barrel fold metal-dependent hydrolase|nr:amidohydrolase family protein [bacterium]